MGKKSKFTLHLVKQADNGSYRIKSPEEDSSQVPPCPAPKERVDLQNEDNAEKEANTEANSTSEFESLFEHSSEDDISSGSSDAYDPDKNKNDHSSNKSKEDDDDEVDVGVKSTKQRRKRKSNQSLQSLQKEKRMRGQDYLGMQKDEFGKKRPTMSRSRREMKPRCTCKHSSLNRNRNCKDITEEQRQRIFNHFWQDMSWGERKIFVRSHVYYVPVKRRRNNSESIKSHRSAAGLIHRDKSEGASVPENCVLSFYFESIFLYLCHGSS
ncbi:uncharacterized protein LOC126176124 [Schistocerca cancellata]|uniref:uncharacterized protein LOC126176124 n=1 Tax=Schistocerca cancellata TaxID=274614 RepID=UPI0021177338|nr:uncharacterized protein LOC126176124 [Schistocerca cancellata]